MTGKTPDKNRSYRHRDSYRGIGVMADLPSDY